MRGPTALELDFQQRPGARGRAVRRAALAAGLACLAFAAFDYASVRAERLALQASLAEAQARAPRPAGTPARGGDDVALARAAASVAEQLGAWWPAFFEALEAAAHDDVALLAVQADPASDAVRVSGEARQFAAMTAYVRRLEATPALKEVVLTAHETRRRDRERPVVFTLAAKWERER